ncbi:YdeI/OmpD-associated family protein [Cohnella candidum]|uniref:DUF1905 domain-containing protein n=1 Tax=Cohnella candidum TaxID=2674991 RepID=A0A3G3K0J7_9BACL|nr:YdeI/OmpD-associated family protein [Cohnella candidum]AYQ73641.1 DUF1905 domain-containing protein [Cohnella candidum]
MSDASAMKTFKGELFRPDGIGTWVYVTVPFPAEEAFGKRGQIRVRGTVNGAAFRSSLMPFGNGAHYLVVGAELREAAGAGVGDTVEVRLEPDPEERVMDAPEDMHEAISANEEAAAYWAGLAYSYRKEYVTWVESAKREETRRSRIGKAVMMLAERKKLK